MVVLRGHLADLELQQLAVGPLTHLLLVQPNSVVDPDTGRCSPTAAEPYQARWLNVKATLQTQLLQLLSLNQIIGAAATMAITPLC